MYYFLRGPWIVKILSRAINMSQLRNAYPSNKDHYALRKSEQLLSVFNFQHSSYESLQP